MGKIKIAVTIMLIALAGCLSPGSVSAQQAASGNYKVDQVYFGSGGSLNSCSSGSTGYCTKQSAGELTVGNTASTNNQIQAGFNTDRQPYLQFIVNTSNIDLGTLVAGTPKTATATFSVKSYVANGYTIQTNSTPPSNAGRTLTGLATPAASAPNTEQFGINLVANTSPSTVGSNPVQVPSSSFSYGTAASGYNTPNSYKYVNGDTIAQSTKSSGETDYTITYLININNVTPGGTYTMAHELVAIGSY